MSDKFEMCTETKSWTGDVGKSFYLINKYSIPAAISCNGIFIKCVVITTIFRRLLLFVKSCFICHMLYWRSFCGSCVVIQACLFIIISCKGYGLLRVLSRWNLRITRFTMLTVANWSAIHYSAYGVLMAVPRHEIHINMTFWLNHTKSKAIHYWKYTVMCTNIHVSIMWMYLADIQLVVSYWHRMTSYMTTSSNGNIFRVTGLLCGEFTGPRWIPHTKASDAELWCFLWSASE